MAYIKRIRKKVNDSKRVKTKQLYFCQRSKKLRSLVESIAQVIAVFKWLRCANRCTRSGHQVKKKVSENSLFLDYRSIIDFLPMSISFPWDRSFFNFNHICNFYVRFNCFFIQLNFTLNFHLKKFYFTGGTDFRKLAISCVTCFPNRMHLFAHLKPRFTFCEGVFRIRRSFYENVKRCTKKDERYLSSSETIRIPAKNPISLINAKVSKSISRTIDSTSFSSFNE